ncbi:MAG: type I-C CRISPR-associated protein Cas8c/Csd1, partial [Candidatus Heimdallarchaeota archaeon]|nr:type I-C CRISPR-associated protein Cas8c/Csd1 [Candidatus Heimdallarchaeota archaeon]
MSWMQKLCETYDCCQSMIGVGIADNEVPLLPICHTTQKAQIEIVLDKGGEFNRARVIPKSEARTIIPCKESSGGRTSGESPHPLCDKLQYIAADYKKYGGNKESYHKSYVELLSRWVEFAKNEKLTLIYHYVKNGSVVKDLIEHGILFEDQDGKFLRQRMGIKEKKDSLGIFDLLPGKIKPNGDVENWQADAFVRWVVEIPNDPQSAISNDSKVIESWIEYYFSIKENKTFCYVTGEKICAANQHPAKLRTDGDKAKLISSGKTRSKNGEIKVNDTCGFTFLGRFINADQACGVGFEVSQK